MWYVSVGHAYIYICVLHVRIPTLAIFHYSNQAEADDNYYYEPLFEVIVT